jgi:hypothetical protein
VIIGDEVVLGGEVRLARERARPAKAVVDERRRLIVTSAALHPLSLPLQAGF